MAAKKVTGKKAVAKKKGPKRPVANAGTVNRGLQNQQTTTRKVHNRPQSDFPRMAAPGSTRGSQGYLNRGRDR